MSAFVDVLAVMEQWGFRHKSGDFICHVDGRQIEQVRSAINELIEAAQLTVGCRAYTDRNDFAMPPEKQHGDVAALMIALARVGAA